MVREMFYLTLAACIGCSGSVDRTPPTRDVGLPEVPPPPLELGQVPADNRPSLDPADPVWKAPAGCTDAAPQVAGTLRSFRCDERVELDVPEGWIAWDGASVWRRNETEVAYTWTRLKTGYLLVLSAHVVKSARTR